jgi:hypothetical protein
MWNKFHLYWTCLNLIVNIPQTIPYYYYLQTTYIVFGIIIICGRMWKNISKYDVILHKRLSIRRFWCPQGILDPIPFRHQCMTVPTADKVVKQLGNQIAFASISVFWCTVVRMYTSFSVSFICPFPLVPNWHLFSG